MVQANGTIQISDIENVRFSNVSGFRIPTVQWDPETRHVYISNGRHLVSSQMIWFSNGTICTGVNFINCFCALHPCAQLLRQ